MTDVHKTNALPVLRRTEPPLSRKKRQARLWPLVVGQSAVVACACRQGRATVLDGRVVEKQVLAFPYKEQVTRGAPARLRRLDGGRVLVGPVPCPRARAWSPGVCLLPVGFRLLHISRRVMPDLT